MTGSGFEGDINLSPQHLEIEVEDHDGLIRYVLPEGELTESNAEGLHNILGESIDRNDLSGVIINFDKTSFMDSTHLAVLLNYARRLRRIDVPLVIEIAQAPENEDKVYTLFSATKLNDTFRIMPPRRGDSI